MAVKESESLVLLTQQNGIVVIPVATPLTRLNYFDGKFLRASDLKTEQDYLRQLVRQSNQAGGSGVVHGFDLTLGGGDTIDLGPGLAISPDGRVLLLPQGVSLSVKELIEKSQELQRFFKKANVVSTDFEKCETASATPPSGATHPNDLYLIVICPAEALCGEEDVYGKLCEEACATSSDRPYAVEGLIVRAVPLVLQTPLPHSKVVSIATRAHLRSRVASAYFEDERERVASMISKFGLEQEVWCLGADAVSGACLPIGVIARAGATTVFLDAWIARRERMDSPPRRYWQWRMMMRPWDVFLAQILQFQCQLRDLLGGGLTPSGQDPCGDARTVIGAAAKKIAELVNAHKEMTPTFSNAAGLDRTEVFKAQLVELDKLSEQLTATEQKMPAPTGDRLLIRGGIIELPSAGYLPIAPDVNATVNQQVRQLMGEGVDLRFCIVRPDFVAHALEEAQHMERISLIEGLEDPKRKPQVDILVPSGEMVGIEAVERFGFAVGAELRSSATVAGQTESTQPKTGATISFQGAARSERLQAGGTAVYLSCVSTSALTPLGVNVNAFNESGALPASTAGNIPTLGLWLSVRSDQDLLQLKPGDKSQVSAEVLLGTIRDNQPQLELRGQMDGMLTAEPPKPTWSVSGGTAVTFSIVGEAFPFKTGNLEFSLLARPQGAGIEVQLNLEKMTFSLNANWSVPANVEAEVGAKIRLSERVISELNLASMLTRDENIFSPGDVNHARAIQGLEFIAAAIKDPSFVNQKSGLLFPPEQPGQQGGIVRATRDWVLFHRRRTKKCEAEVQTPPTPPPTPPPPVKTVCQTVFRAKTLDFFQKAVREISAMISAGGGEIKAVIEQNGLEKLGDVLFEENTATVAGDGASLNVVVGKWKQSGGIVSAAAVYSQSSAVEAVTQVNQTKAIAQKINDNVGAVEPKAFTVLATMALPTSCPAFSIVAGPLP